MLPENLNVQLIMQWRTFMTVLHTLAISSAVLRLLRRHSSRRLWHDDCIALFAVVMDCTIFVALHIWTRSVPYGTTFGRGTTITFYWIGAVCSLLGLWSARISLALAIVQISPPGRTVRQFATGMAWFFTILAIAILLGITSLCGRNTSWHDSPEVQCDIPKGWVIVGFSASLLTDALLVLTPFYLVWQLKLPGNQRQLVLAGFSASAWTGIAGGVCFFFMLRPNHWGLSRATVLVLFGHVTVPVSIIACNAVVILGYVYQLIRRNEDLEHSLSVAASNTMSSPTTITLTNPDSISSQDVYHRGLSYNGYSFSEQYPVSLNPSSLFIRTQMATTPTITSRFTV